MENDCIKIVACDDGIGTSVLRESLQRDLLPELQGALPISVELKPLIKEVFRRILTEMEAKLIHQYKMLLAAEDIDLEFTEDAKDL